MFSLGDSEGDLLYPLSLESEVVTVAELVSDILCRFEWKHVGVVDSQAVNL